MIGLAAMAAYVQADCYPGDVAYTQEIYHGVTSDNIRLSHNGGSPISRRSLSATPWPGTTTMGETEGSRKTTGPSLEIYMSALHSAPMLSPIRRVTTAYLAGSNGRAIIPGLGSLTQEPFLMVPGGLVLLTSKDSHMFCSQ